MMDAHRDFQFAPTMLDTATSRMKDLAISIIVHDSQEGSAL